VIGFGFKMDIPKGDNNSSGPCWIPHIWEGRICRPIIVCACGQRNTAAAHHIHADGRVTASYYHAKEPIPSQGWAGGGCGFHEFIRLMDYDQGEFPPEV